LAHCIKRHDPKWIYFRASCVEKVDTISLGYAYKEAGWMKIGNVGRIAILDWRTEFFHFFLSPVGKASVIYGANSDDKYKARLSQ
jgi:hypothetical protein